MSPSLSADPLPPLHPDRLAWLIGSVVLMWFLSWTPYAVVSLMAMFGYQRHITPLLTMIPGKENIVHCWLAIVTGKVIMVTGRVTMVASRVIMVTGRVTMVTGR